MSNESKGQKRRELARYKRLHQRNPFLYPANLPMVISFGLSFMVSGIGALFHLRYPSWLLDLLGLTLFASVGISGSIIVYRGEHIDKWGNIVRGWRAYFSGIFLTIIGIGVTALLIYNLFIK